MANLLARTVMANMSGAKGKQAVKPRGPREEEKEKKGNLTLEEQALLSKIIEKTEIPGIKEPGKPSKEKKISFSEIGKRGLKAND